MKPTHRYRFWKGGRWASGGDYDIVFSLGPVVPEATTFHLLSGMWIRTPIFCLSGFEFYHFPLKECHWPVKEPGRSLGLKHSKASRGSGTRNSRHEDPGGPFSWLLGCLSLGCSPSLYQSTSAFFFSMFMISRRQPLFQSLNPKSRFLGERIHLIQFEPEVYCWCESYRQGARATCPQTW